MTDTLKANPARPLFPRRRRSPTVCFQAGHIPSWHGSCERRALWPFAAVSRWPLLLLSLLRLTGHDAAVLWRSLPEATPLSAVFAGGARVRLNYPRHQELRAWPSFEALGEMRAEPAPLPHGELAGQITRAQGGHV